MSDRVEGGISGLSGGRPTVASAVSPRLLGALLAGIAAASWTVIVGGIAVWRHSQFLSHRYDLGNMVQAVWSTTQGRPLEMTDAATGEQIVRVAAHVDPILVLLAPLWVAYPDPATLLVVQACALASGVYPVVRLARKHVRDPVATALLGAWYLAFPWVVWNAIDDFHPVSLAIPLLLYAIWFLDERRLVPFALCAGLALLTGELVGLTVAALGIWYAIGHRRYRVGAAISALGVGWTMLCLTVVVPAFNDGGSSRYYSRFESVGGSPIGVLKTVVTDPGEIAAQLTTARDLEYIGALALPTAALALGAPLLLLAALPQLGINLLSDWWSTIHPAFHYTAVLLPGLLAATVIAVSRFPARARPYVCGALFGVALLTTAAYPPRPGAQDFVFAPLEPRERRAAMREALELIPPDIAVTATSRIGAHLSSRRTIHLFPTRRGAEWAVIDLQNPWLQVVGERADPKRFIAEVRRFESEQGWSLVFERADVRVYRREQ